MRKISIPFYVVPALLGFGLLLAGCQNTPAKQASAAPAGELRSTPASGSVHYAADAQHSEVDFSGDVYLAPAFKDSIFSLKLPVKGFEVDRAEARSAAGADFASKPSAKDIQGTTEHMMGAGTLDVEKYPEVTIQSVSVSGEESKAEMTVRITLHGTARDVKVPVTVSRDGDDLTAAADFELRQSEFGITPFSAAGGALQVADAFKVHLKILCRKVSQ
jgi:hypothetical protein